MCKITLNQVSKITIVFKENDQLVLILKNRGKELEDQNVEVFQQICLSILNIVFNYNQLSVFKHTLCLVTDSGILIVVLKVDLQKLRSMTRFRKQVVRAFKVYRRYILGIWSGKLQ